MYVKGTIRNRKYLSDKSVAWTVWSNSIRAHITATTSLQVLTKCLKDQLLQPAEEMTLLHRNISSATVLKANHR